jgi:serine protease
MREGLGRLGLIGVALVIVWATSPSTEVAAAHRTDLGQLALVEEDTPVPEAAPAAGPGQLVVDLVDGADEGVREAVSQRLGATLTWVHPLAEDEALAVAEVDDLGAAMARIAGMDEVEVAEPMLTWTLLGEGDVPGEDPAAQVPGAGTPNDPLWPRQWHLARAGAEAGWAHTPGGEGVVVAVVDTGVARVPDLVGARVLEGASFVPGAPTANDDHGHGTHVAGTIAQATGNGLGAAGMAPAATILPVKVLSAHSGGTSAQVAAGIDYAVDSGAQVINLSLGGPVYSAVIHLAAKKARAKGVLLVAAAGNDGRRVVSWPGALREVIGVSSFGPDGSLAPYSNHGFGVDIAAPGGDTRKPGGGVLQDTLDGAGGHAWRWFQGTSMAAPHVSGAAAVLLSTGGLSVDNVERVLLAGADQPLWGPEFGWGRLDLGASIDLLGGRDGGRRFAVGALLAAIVSGASGAGVAWRAGATLVAGLAAGGAFFLPLGSPSLLMALLARGVLSWPVVLVGPWWGQVPLWLSALLPCAFVAILGPFRAVRWVALGVSCGVAAHLLVGLWAGSLAPWWIPGSWVTTWLGANAAVSLLAAALVVWVERLDARARA